MFAYRFGRPIAFALFVAMTMRADPSSAQNGVVTNQNRQVLDFYGGRPAARTLSQMPRRSAIQPASTGQLQHNGKPFQGTTTGNNTVSPYLNLFREEQGATDPVPSYYTFVRPQLDQQASYQQQQREIELLQRQVQGRSTAQRPVTGSGTQARYFDTAQFYGGWRR